MGIAKIIQTGSYQFDDMAASIVPLHRGGVDKGYFEKRASANVFAKEIEKLAADGGIKGHTVLHVIIVGDKEAYGYNRNADSFSEADNKKAHTGFKTNGHVFKNHQNKDPLKKTGSVVATAHNDEMRRIELLCAMNNEKYADELAGFERGDDIPFSMGSLQDHDVCFPANTRVELEGGLLPISAIREGDCVRTHTGALQPVTRLLSRSYTGTVVEVSARGLPVSLVATANHPVLALKYDAVHQGTGCGGGRRRRLEPTDAQFPQATWVPAGTLDRRDYIGYPVPIGGDTPFGAAGGYAVGFAYGDGAVTGKHTKTMGWRHRGVQFSTDLNDCEITERLQSNIAKHHQNSHHYAHPEKSESTVLVCSHDFGEEVDRLIGRGSKTKHLAEEVMSWDRESRRGLIGGLLDSDGSVDPIKGSGRINTTSPDGARCIMRLLLSLGVISGTHTEEYASEWATGTMYVIHINAAAIYDFRDVSVRAARHARPAGVRESGFMAQGFAWFPVDSVQAQEVVGLPVYNLSVSKDETYIAEGFQVHNCSICKHKAPTIAQHCHHLKEKLGEVLSDGRFVGMDNPDPNYFDASSVFKPADRIGYALAKVASVNGFVGGHDLAAAMGIRPWGSVKQATLARLASIEKQLTGVARKAVTKPADLSDSAVKALKTAAERHGISAVLGHLHSRQQLLSFQDFTTVIVGESKLASVVDIDEDRLTNGFAKLAESDEEVGSLDGEAPLGGGALGLDEDTEHELATATSMKQAALADRVIRATIIVPRVKVAGLADPLKAEGLASLYLHYKLAFASHDRNRDDPFVLQAVTLSHVLRPTS